MRQFFSTYIIRQWLIPGSWEYFLRRIWIQSHYWSIQFWNIFHSYRLLSWNDLMITFIVILNHSNRISDPFHSFGINYNRFVSIMITFSMTLRWFSHIISISYLRAWKWLLFLIKMIIIIDHFWEMIYDLHRALESFESHIRSVSKLLNWLKSINIDEMIEWWRS